MARPRLSQSSASLCGETPTFATTKMIKTLPTTKIPAHTAMRTAPKSSSAFTIIEFLIVLGIIVLLACALIPCLAIN
jgi:type II secretory pathway pseudopilin PulG